MTLKSKTYTLLKRVNRKIQIPIESQPSKLFPLLPELPLPEGVSERKLRDFLESVLVSNVPPKEMKNYCKQYFRRFVYTYGLTQNLARNCLELGANPYFTTMLLRKFTQVDIFDVYSGYGVDGRHNREYNKHELYLLLRYLWFDIKSMFYTDVYPNHANDYSSITKVKPILSQLRQLDLGQYIFIKACNAKKEGEKKPAFLYRSYPDDQIKQELKLMS